MRTKDPDSSATRRVGFRRSRRFAFAGIVVVVAVVAGISVLVAGAMADRGGAAADPAGSPSASVFTGTDAVTDISMMYTVSSLSGTLVATPGTADEYTLTLADTDDQVLWFADAPARHAGVLPTAGLAEQWAGFGFDDSPPNTAIVLHDGSPDADTIVVEMGQPQFDPDTGTLSAPVTVLSDEEQKQASGHNLDSHLASADAAVPASFSEVSLFIDNTSARVVNGCAIQAFAYCPGAQLTGADLHGVNLQCANLTGAYLMNANLQGANLACATLSRANLNGANLQSASLSQATLNYAVMASTALQNADLSYVNLYQTPFSGASFVGTHIHGTNMANAIGANLTGAIQ